MKTLMQPATPDAMRGWASALNSPFIGDYNVQSRGQQGREGNAHGLLADLRRFLYNF